MSTRGLKRQSSCRIDEVTTKMAALGTARCLLRSLSRMKTVPKSKHVSLKCCTRTLCTGTQDTGVYYCMAYYPHLCVFSTIAPTLLHGDLASTNVLNNSDTLELS